METISCSRVCLQERQPNGRHVRSRRKYRGRLWVFAAPLLIFVLYFNWSAKSAAANAKRGNNLPAKEASHSVAAAENHSLNSKANSTSSITDWNLILVNPWHNIPSGYKVTLKKLLNGQAVDERCYPDLQQMMDDCRAAGLSPLICSSYRSNERQEQLYRNKINLLIGQGYSSADARKEAGKVIALPGTSEHQLGLAVDIVDVNNQNLDSSQEDTDVQQWLMQNSWRYGFVLRYPTDKSDITGIIYEPWHYRYVGKEAAEYIYKNNICLEEYLKLLGQQ